MRVLFFPDPFCAGNRKIDPCTMMPAGTEISEVQNHKHLLEHYYSTKQLAYFDFQISQRVPHLKQAEALRSKFFGFTPVTHGLNRSRPYDSDLLGPR